MLFEREVYILALRKLFDRCNDILLIDIHPSGYGSCVDILDKHFKFAELAAVFLQSNNIALAYFVGRNVDLLAVDGEVGVADELTGLTAGHRKAHAIDDVVQTALDGDEQVVTGLAGSRSGLLIVIMELLFQDTVDELDLLLLSKLDAILALFLFIWLPGLRFVVFFA